MALAKIFEVFVMIKKSDDWPMDAVPDFFSGGLQATFGGDSHVEMEACMTPDQDLYDLMSTMMEQAGADDLEGFKDSIQKSIQIYKKDLEGCQDREAVWDQVQALDSYWKDFEASTDDWEQLVWDNYDTWSHTVDGYLTQMVGAWDHELWYQAGQLFGLAGTFVLAMPESLENIDDETAKTMVQFIREIQNSVYSQ